MNVVGIPILKPYTKWLTLVCELVYCVCRVEEWLTQVVRRLPLLEYRWIAYPLMVASYPFGLA